MEDSNEVETAGRPPQSSTPPTSGRVPRSRLDIAATIVLWVIVIFSILALVATIIAAIIVANLGDPTF
jgi:hypothetical protein